MATRLDILSAGWEAFSPTQVICRCGQTSDSISAANSTIFSSRVNFFQGNLDEIESTTFCVDSAGNHDILVPTTNSPRPKFEQELEQNGPDELGKWTTAN
jgi:hypothetical protein